MSWARIDDGFHRNAKQLRMSDAAFRVYVCSLSYCAQERDPTGHLSREQARALVGSLGKGVRVIRDLVRLNAWEEVEDGYLIHDFDQYIDRGSSERMRKLRDRMRRRGDEDVTSQVTPDPQPSDVSRARAHAGGNPVPEPVPVIPPVLDGVSDYVPNPIQDSPQGGGVTSLIAEQPRAPVLTTIQGVRDQGYERFLAELNQATGRQFRGDAESRRLYERCLQQGRTRDDLLAAARGVALSKHHMGLNDSGMPYNAPANVLRSKVLDQLISLGRGEIGFVREETAEERNKREVHEWAVAKDAERAAERERKARGGGA